jgi:C4-dicarboxylate-specific signal transduction histidine kinase
MTIPTPSWARFIRMIARPCCTLIVIANPSCTSTESFVPTETCAGSGIAGSRIRDQKGEVYRVAGIAEDITERKRAEQALQEAQAELVRMNRIATMGELTASIAHEINQPLAAVVGSASLRWLAMRPPNLKQARKAVTSAIQEANRASEVIARIRSLLRKGSGEMAPLDVNEVIREVLAWLTTSWSGAG